MKKVAKIFAILMVVIITAVVVPIDADADFGDYSGDSDYGDDGGSSYDSDYDDYDDDYSSSGGGGGFSISEFFGFLIFLFAIFSIFWAQKKNRKRQSQKVGTPSRGSPPKDLLPLDAIWQWDKNFSPDEMKARLSKLYVQMQQGWTAKDISPLRGDFTDEQFAQFDRQLQTYRDKGQTNYTERIAVLDVNIMGVKQDNSHDILVVNMSTRIVDYTLDDKTGKLISGDKNKEKFMVYEWTLIRPRGAQTNVADKDSAFTCPNCGATIDINKSAKCPYCDSIVTKVEYDWVIAGIRGISQRTS